MTKHIYTLSELSDNLPWKDTKAVLVGGCFDLLHYGHLQFLQHAKESGGTLIVALESDEFIKEKKKREPVHSQQQRADILTSLRCVDYVILLPLMHGNEEYTELVEKVKPEIIAVTEKDPYIQVKEKQAAAVGATVKVVVPLLETFSSTQILQYENIFSG